MRSLSKAVTNWHRLISVVLVSTFAITAFAADCKVNYSGISDEYVGGCVNGLAHGLGKANGKDTYEGEFKQGNRHGRGVWVSSSGTRYDGEWFDDLLSGKGVLISADGAKYVGSFLKNQRSGIGETNWLNGGKYRGEYQQNRRNGKGIFYWPDGMVYEGNYINDKRSGFGIVTVPRIAYKTEARSKLGSWDGEIFIEKGYFDDGALQFSCTSPQACKQELAKREFQERERIANACNAYYPGRSIGFKPAGFVYFGSTLDAVVLGKGNGSVSIKIVDRNFRDDYGKTLEVPCTSDQLQ